MNSNRKFKEGDKVRYIDSDWIVGKDCYNTPTSVVIHYPISGSKFGWIDNESDAEFEYIHNCPLIEELK